MPDPNDATVRAEILGWNDPASPKQRLDLLAREEPLEIRVHDKSVAVTMRTPGHDQELAAGFLLSEGLIQSAEDIVEIEHRRPGDLTCPQNRVNVVLAPSVRVNFEQLTRHVFASSSCGICGKATIESVHQHFRPLTSSLRVAGQTLLQLSTLSRAEQVAFNETGGLHAATLFDSDGQLMVLREDVGRHNAVDKVIGWGLFEKRTPFSKHILLVSGRASFEIMQKALAAHIPIVAAVSAPSSLAVQFAQESGQTLIGFLRGRSFNVYAHPERIFQ